MRTSSATAAQNQQGAKTGSWQPWNTGAFKALSGTRSVRVEPAPWLRPHQARRLHALVDDILTYQSLVRLGAQIPDSHLALRKQYREITARLIELLETGVRVRWRAAGNLGVALLARPLSAGRKTGRRADIVDLNGYR